MVVFTHELVKCTTHERLRKLNIQNADFETSFYKNETIIFEINTQENMGFKKNHQFILRGRLYRAEITQA